MALKTTNACFSTDVQFSSEPWKFELKNDIGASICWSFNRVKTTAYDVSDEKVYNVNGLRKLGVVRNGELTINYLINSNASLSLCPHLKTKFFLIMFFNGKTI